MLDFFALGATKKICHIPLNYNFQIFAYTYIDISIYIYIYVYLSLNQLVHIFSIGCLHIASAFGRLASGRLAAWPPGRLTV